MNAKLERAILQSLDASPRPLAIPVILGAVGYFVEAPTRADLEAALRRLEDKRQIVGTETEDHGNVYTLTAAGKLRLAQ